MTYSKSIPLNLKTLPLYIIIQFMLYIFITLLSVTAFIFFFYIPMLVFKENLVVRDLILIIHNLVITFAIALLVFGYKREFYNSRTWNETVATVVKSEVTQYLSADEPISYNLNLLLVYEIDGQKFEKSISPKTRGYNILQTASRVLDGQTKIKIIYDPKKYTRIKFGVPTPILFFSFDIILVILTTQILVSFGFLVQLIDIFLFFLVLLNFAFIFLFFLFNLFLVLRYGKLYGFDMYKAPTIIH